MTDVTRPVEDGSACCPQLRGESATSERFSNLCGTPKRTEPPLEPSTVTGGCTDCEHPAETPDDVLFDRVCASTDGSYAMAGPSRVDTFPF